MIFGFEMGFVYQNESNHPVQPVEEYFVRSAINVIFPVKIGTASVSPYVDIGLYSGYTLYDKKSTKMPATQLGIKIGYGTPLLKNRFALFVNGDYHYRAHTREHWFEGDTGVYAYLGKGISVKAYVGRYILITPETVLQVKDFDYSFTLPTEKFEGMKYGFSIYWRGWNLFYEYLEGSDKKTYKHLIFDAYRYQPSMIRLGVMKNF